MRVYNAAITGSSVECEVTAHNSPIAVMAWNQDASLLASASSKGTVLRVHRMPKVLCFSRFCPAVFSFGFERARNSLNQAMLVVLLNMLCLS